MSKTEVGINKHMGGAEQRARERDQVCIKETTPF